MFLVTACSQAKFAVVNFPILFSDVEITKDIQFSVTDETLGLDVYSPQNVENAPVLVFFYGGGWKDGSKDDYKLERRRRGGKDKKRRRGGNGLR